METTRTMETIAITWITWIYNRMIGKIVNDLRVSATIGAIDLNQIILEFTLFLRPPIFLWSPQNKAIGVLRETKIVPIVRIACKCFEMTTMIGIIWMIILKPTLIFYFKMEFVTVHK